MNVDGERYAAFLRGMNLGGRRISNKVLAEHVAALGFGDVQTFRASGNLILTAKDDEKTVAQHLENGLREALGYEVPTFVRSSRDMIVMKAHEPFEGQIIEASKGKLQVSILARKPSVAVKRKVLAHSSDEDLLAFHGGELYWLPSGGLLESALDLKAIDGLLGLSTRRTKGTIDLIAGKFFGAGS